VKILGKLAREDRSDDLIVAPNRPAVDHAIAVKRTRASVGCDLCGGKSSLRIE